MRTVYDAVNNLPDSQVMLYMFFLCLQLLIGNFLVVCSMKHTEDTKDTKTVFMHSMMFQEVSPIFFSIHLVNGKFSTALYRVWVY